MNKEKIYGNMDEHREQFNLAREFCTQFRDQLVPSMKQCYEMFRKWHFAQSAKYPALNEYQFRTVCRKQYH